MSEKRKSVDEKSCELKQQLFLRVYLSCHQTWTFYHKFPFMLFSYFSISILFIQKFQLSIKDYLLLNYTFLYMIIFLRIILNFQSHQICILSAVLGMAWNREWLSCYRGHVPWDPTHISFYPRGKILEYFYIIQTGMWHQV